MSGLVVQRALDRLGIDPEGVLMVHSSCKQLSRDGYDLPLVLKGLVEFMKPGTLLMPTMSWRFVNAANPVFDERQTPSNTGFLTELFRREYAEVRSCHPTHSVAGKGGLAEAILSAHHVDDTPCSSNSPFGRHAESKGWILMLGISMDCCTLIHYVEETVAPDLYLKPASERETYLCRDRNGTERTVALRRHRFLPRNYFQFQDALAENGLLRITRVDNTICRVFRTADLVEVVTRQLQKSPDGIIAKPGEPYRMM